MVAMIPALPQNGFEAERLEAYTQSALYATQIGRMTKTMKSELGKRSAKQLNKASIAIEGQFAAINSREPGRDFLRELFLSKGSLFESLAELKLALKTELITTEQHNVVSETGESLAGKLDTLINLVSKSLGK